MVLKLLARCHPRAMYKALLAAQGVKAAEADAPAATAASIPVMTAAELDTETGSLLVGYSDGLVLYLERFTRMTEVAAQHKALPPKPGADADDSHDAGEPGKSHGNRVSTGKLIRVFGPADPRQYWNVAIATTLNKGPINALALCEPWRM